MLFIVISIFLVESINSAVPNFNGFDREQLNFINALNIQRAAFDHYTVNMQKLIWNKDLQGLAESIDKNSLSTFHNQTNLRYMAATNYENGAQKLDDKRIIFYNDYCREEEENRQPESKDYTPGLEHLNPLQTIIGCAKRTDLLQDHTVVCLLGPSGTLPIASCPQSIATCANGFEYKNGFCSNSDLPDSDQLMYISALNEKRRQIAVKDDIANMYEFVWNRNLHDIALNVEQHFDSRILQKRKWRMTEFVDFEKGLDYDPNSKEEIYFYNVAFEIHKEQFRPLQREIACVAIDKKWNTGYNYLCLLGPEAEKVEGTKGQPGSQCDFNYVENNGLCSIVRTSAPPPESQVPKPSTESPVCNPTDAVTSGTIQPPLTRYTTEELTPEPPPQVPKELEDYEELDGDEYDPDFPTVPPRKYYFY
ncbi:hypothetical protein GCK72_004481 [Caenorhabditis remanei]|uniref:SCP domain-containing protein n=1 Tax=Caenorhabditis remanei TaxID=31234 RepID=A0A6A5HE01_CAERE|nr:hypothetical protein GCK72_004481 [Caenorhabditis remanei]KAF1764532.1 hypothetical protein GCK72_004481 [Caenorhabditis remanei]